MMTNDLAEKIWNELNHANSILLHFHPNPDGDSMGSALGLAHILRDLGKSVTVIAGDSPVPEYLSHLPGAKDVRVEAFVNIDQSEFDLFVILDSASLEQISRQSEVVFTPNLKTIVIDHHGTNKGYAQENLIDPSSPATAQLVYELAAWKGVQISVNAATCLLVGLYTDTGGFQYPPTGKRTFTAAAALAEISLEYHQAIFPINNTLSAQNLAYQGLALRNVELFPLPEGKQLSMSIVSAQERLEAGVTPEFADKSQIANMLKSVAGWEVGVAMVETEPGDVKISFRTRDPKKYHVGNIAAKLGGGGHPAAAGLTLKMSLEEAKKAVVEAVQAV
jgi:phosphoesterase RecJ-like protein